MARYQHRSFSASDKRRERDEKRLHFDRLRRRRKTPRPLWWLLLMAIIVLMIFYYLSKVR